MRVNHTDNPIKVLGQYLLEGLYPQKKSCAFCGRHWSLSRLSAGLCPICLQAWLQIRAYHPICPVCGSFDCGNPCAGPCSDMKTLDCIIAAAPYSGVYRQRIMAFKYNGYKSLADPLAYMMSGAWREKEQILLSGSDRAPVLVPVPMHIEKEKARGYNQSRLLAYALSRELGFPVQELLCRPVEGRIQAGLDKRQRQTALDQVFQWARVTSQSGGAAILVDDVVTTSATLESCGKILADNGFDTVWGLTFAGGVGLGAR